MQVLSLAEATPDPSGGHVWCMCGVQAKMLFRFLLVLISAVSSALGSVYSIGEYIIKTQYFALPSLRLALHFSPLYRS